MGFKIRKKEKHMKTGICKENKINIWEDKNSIEKVIGKNEEIYR